jgi:m7GpppX diphosphatase
LHRLFKANIVHPATQKHIDKYLSSPAHLVCETPALYHAVTLPCIRAEQFTLDWVYNVLEHKKEADRIIYENTDPNVGFILAPDFKWSGKQVPTGNFISVPDPGYALFFILR